MSKILYVEDNEDNIFMLQTRLQRKGYEVIIARDGQEGLDKAKGENPDIILMDVGLPIIDGYEATKKLKADPATEKIPIIVLTAHALSSDQQMAMDSGADGYAPKPVNFLQLLEQIDSLLDSTG